MAAYTRIAIFIHSLATVNYLLPRGETLFHLPPINILEIFKDFSSTTPKNSKTFSPAKISWPQIINNPKIFEDFFAGKFVFAANHQYPGNIQRLFPPPAAATSSSNQQQQPAAATSSSNQQQQSAAAISSSNQQQQPAEATSGSNQQQQSAAATSSSNQQQQLSTAISIHHTSSTYAINADLR